jgi:hypothetical protein
MMANPKCWPNWVERVIRRGNVHCGKTSMTVSSPVELAVLALRGLDPSDPRDASADLNADGYTNIEEFINRTDPVAKASGARTRNTYVDLWSSAPALRSRLERE